MVVVSKSLFKDPNHQYQIPTLIKLGENHISFAQWAGNDSWIYVVKEQFLNKFPGQSHNIPELLEDLRALENTRSKYAQHSTIHNYANFEMTRRIMDLTSPGGFVRKIMSEIDFLHRDGSIPMISYINLF